MRLKRLLPALGLSALIVGCGGTGGSGTLGGNAPLASTYRTTFTRGAAPNTSLLMFFDQKGRVGAQISSGSEVEWAGLANVAGSTVDISLQPVSSSVSGNVLLQGTFVPGTPPTINITLSGAATGSFVATQLTGAGIAPYSGTYNGSFTGSESGTFTVHIDSSGNVTGVLNSPQNGNNLLVEGTLQLDGAIEFHYLVSGGTGSYTGFVFLPPAATSFAGAGAWTFGTGSSLTGTWTGGMILIPSHP